ncbi:MAG: alpha/beta fold hydrolase [Solirubrobacterales bacterium]|nr:alpha/beta fold hydrolase [Solirubrobacterales bacterium]
MFASPGRFTSGGADLHHRVRRFRGLSLRQGRRSVVVALLVVLSIGALAAGAAADGTHRQRQPEMHFGDRIRVATVCFSVTNPAGGRSTLYGLRYTSERGSYWWRGRAADRDQGPTPAIVLVHGIASSTENWDFSPTWSVARALAAAGYVVFSYDRLGYAKSSYFDQPGGGLTLTTAAHRAELHEVVDEVETGDYTMTEGSDCSAPQRPARTRNPRAVIIGHSAGGWIVAGYPGTYHDVAAMIQTDIDGSGAQPPPGTPIAPGPSTSVTPDPNHPDYFEFFQTRQECENFNVYPPGEVAYIVQIACAPPFLDSPYGELQDFSVKFPQNDAAIDNIGPSIPVLLTSGDHDGVDPPVDAAADYAYYQQHCGCDVTKLLLPDTAHLFMVHQSLPLWVNYVVHWLTAKGLAPDPARPPVPCTECVVPFVR